MTLSLHAPDIFHAGGLLTVVTASLSERAPLLEINRASVPDCLPHLVWVDEAETPMQVKVNTMVESAQTEWVAQLDDDCYWLGSHLSAIAPRLDSRADVVYTWDAGPTLPRENSNEWAEPYMTERMSMGPHWIDGNFAIRRETFLSVGGLDAGYWPPDLDLNIRLHAAGARFLCVPRRTWVYRSRAMSARVLGHPFTMGHGWNGGPG